MQSPNVQRSTGNGPSNKITPPPDNRKRACLQPATPAPCPHQSPAPPGFRIPFHDSGLPGNVDEFRGPTDRTAPFASGRKDFTDRSLYSLFMCLVSSSNSSSDEVCGCAPPHAEHRSRRTTMSNAPACMTTRTSGKIPLRALGGTGSGRGPDAGRAQTQRARKKIPPGPTFSSIETPENESPDTCLLGRLFDNG
eukprot:gene1746-biopygen13923